MVVEPDTPTDSPLRLADVVSSPEYRALATPAAGVGEPAPDFTLDGVTLSRYAGRKPVALIFGSYT